MLATIGNTYQAVENFLNENAFLCFSFFCLSSYSLGVFTSVLENDDNQVNSHQLKHSLLEWEGKRHIQQIDKKGEVIRFFLLSSGGKFFHLYKVQMCIRTHNLFDVADNRCVWLP